MKSPNRFAAKERRLQSHHNQINRLSSAIARFEATSQQLSTLRLVVVTVGLLLTLLAVRASTTAISVGVFLLALVFFSILVGVHRRLRYGMRRFRIWRSIKQEQVARMTLDWEQLPAELIVPNGERSPLEVDFDLVGEHSLHRLLDITVSAESSQRLRSWLATGQANSAEIAYRQTIIRELAPRHTFRNQLRLNARLVNDKNSQWDSKKLHAWVTRPEDPLLQRLLYPAIGLAFLTMLLFGLAQAAKIGDWWQLSLFAYAVVNVFALRHTGQAFGEAGFLRDNLEQLQTVFSVLERYSYRKTPALKALCHLFVSDDASNLPSSQLRRVVRIVGGMGITMGNPVVAMLCHVLFPWHIWLTLQLGQVKQQLSADLPQWLDSWFELEALSALANFAYLNPHYQFPVESDTVPFEATDLGHPLIVDEDKISNSTASGAVGTINLITGSNMAGKSTYLRTVGINLCLAYAGTVVDATRFRYAPARLASCIRVSDSIADGFSYFYAEVRCLKAILDALESPDPLPLIYFIDEIFRGTNNRERLIGSRSLIQAMAGKHGVGLLSTHDLELVQLADGNPRIQNTHFREDVVDGRMVFDYLLREGPCPTTNALRIMALAGLPVED